MKNILTAALLIGFTSMAYTQNLGQSLNQLFNTNNSTQNTSQKSNTLGRGLSNTDIASGLKEALSIGTNSASQTLSNKDGFFKNAAVKILLPPEVATVEKTLRKYGMGHLADDLILKMNRAAENAAKEAAPIFLSAIKQITISDAVSILNGGNGSATRFLKKSTHAQLVTAFTPVIDKTLSQSGAQLAWTKFFNAYNALGIFKKVNADLTQYVAEKATDGMFVMIEQEENKIRKNPMSYGSGLLQKVFSK